MKFLELTSLAHYNFAHSYEIANYDNEFSPDINMLELSYIIEGEFNIKKGNNIYKAEKGDIICLIRDEKINIYSESYHHHHTVCVTAKYKFVENPNLGLYLPLVIPHSKETEEIKKLIDEFIFSTYIFENSPTKTTNNILQILCKIDKISKNKEKNNQPKSSILTEKAKKYIQRNINQPITQIEVAKFLDVSPGYLCNIFKQTEGISLIKYVNSVKLKNIHSLIKKEKLKLYQAAEMYGYTDANYVSALYKRMFGHSITTEPSTPKTSLANQKTK